MEKEITPSAPIGSSLQQDDWKDHAEIIASQQQQQQDADANSLTRVVSGPPYSIFSRGAKIFVLFMISVSALVSPFGATLFYPVINVLSKQLNVSQSLVNLSITTYMIAQAIAPALLAGMSDNSGRRLSLMICFSISIVANIGLALQTNYAALLVLRCVQAGGGSATIAITIAVVADIATSAQRGSYVGYAMAGILVGPAFGPTIGGALAQYLGWRSIFWFLAIFGASMLGLIAVFFPETCRNVVGNGSIPAKGINQSVIGYLAQRKQPHPAVEDAVFAGPRNSVKRCRCNFPNPLRTLKILKDKESAMILFYNGFFFTGQMVISAGLPYMLQQEYGYDELRVGLCFMSLGMGSLVCALTIGHVVDWNFRRHAKLLGITIIAGKQEDLWQFPIETARLQVVVPNHILGSLSLIGFGWAIKFRTHIAGPEIILFFLGYGISTAFNVTNTLLIDLHRDTPATATAAVNFVRCLLSAGGVAAIVPMIQAMNPGWTFTFLGLLYLAMVPMIFVIMKYGQQWRDEAADKKRRKAESISESIRCRITNC